MEIHYRDQEEMQPVLGISSLQAKFPIGHNCAFS